MRDMNNGTRVAAIMRLNNLGYEDVAKRVRAAGSRTVKRQHIEQLVNYPTRQPRYLPNLAKAFGMTVEQWLRWNPQESDEPPPQSVTLPVSETEIAPGYVRFHLHDFAASAGPGAGGDDYPEVVRVLDLAEWWCRERGLPRPFDRIRVLTCRGDSMRGDIEDGDLLFVDTQRAHFDGPGIYVMNLMGNAVVKRLTLQLDGRLAVLSSNPAYAPEYLTKDQMDQLHIGGRVVTSLSSRRW